MTASENFKIPEASMENSGAEEWEGLGEVEFGGEQREVHKPKHMKEGGGREEGKEKFRAPRHLRRRELTGEVRDLADKNIEAGDSRIPESRQEEWAKHVEHLYETADNLDGAKERVDATLEIMRRLGDGKRELADLGDRADDDDIRDIARDFRKMYSTVNIEPGRWGRQEDSEMNKVIYAASFDDEGKDVLRDVLKFSPQGLRVFQAVWPEELWSDGDRELVEEAQERNAQDYRRARETAEEAGTLDEMVKARHLRQGQEAFGAWSGEALAEKRKASWEGFVQKYDPEVVEATLEIMDGMNRGARTEDLVAVLDDNEFDEKGRSIVRRAAATYHARGPEFFEASNRGELSLGEQRNMAVLRAKHEECDPGVYERIEKMMKPRRGSKNELVLDRSEQEDMRDDVSEEDDEARKARRESYKAAEAEKRQRDLEKAREGLTEEELAIVDGDLKRMEALKKAKIQLAVYEREFSEAEQKLAEAKAELREASGIKTWFSGKARFKKGNLKGKVEGLQKTLDTDRSNVEGMKKFIKDRILAGKDVPMDEKPRLKVIEGGKADGGAAQEDLEELDKAA